MAVVDVPRLSSLPQAVNTEPATMKVVVANTTAASVLPTPRLTHLAFSAHLDAYRHRWRPPIRGCQVTGKYAPVAVTTHAYPVNAR